MSGKRSYTVPVLLVLITVMATMLIMLYSKQLLAAQTEKSEEGKRLAERYTQAVLFADRLRDAADLLLKDDSTEARARAKMWLGESAARSEAAASIFAEAASRSGGGTYESAFVSYFEAMETLFAEEGGRMRLVAGNEGPLTQEEKEALTAVFQHAGAMRESLERFRPPTLDAGFRHMAAGEDWVDPSDEAGKALLDLAGKLK